MMKTGAFPILPGPLRPADSSPPSIDFATLQYQGEPTSPSLVLAFDDTRLEWARWRTEQRGALGLARVRVYCRPAARREGAVCWRIAFVREDGGRVGATIDPTPVQPDGVAVAQTYVMLPTYWRPGEMTRVELMRDGGAAGDDLPGHALVSLIEIDIMPDDDGDWPS